MWWVDDLRLKYSVVSLMLHILIYYCFLFSFDDAACFITYHNFMSVVVCWKVSFMKVLIKINFIFLQGPKKIVGHKFLRGEELLEWRYMLEEKAETYIIRQYEDACLHACLDIHVRYNLPINDTTIWSILLRHCSFF